MREYTHVYGAGRLLADKVMTADNLWLRGRGLLGRNPLTMNEGLLIKPCKGVHMFGMRHCIDVVFLTDDGVITKLEARLPPMGFSICLHACQALELAPGGIDHFGLSVGMRLTFCASANAEIMSSDPLPFEP